MFIRGSQHAYVFIKHHELEEDIIILLKEQRGAGQSLFASTTWDGLEL
jgi:hypothetical protein